MSKRKAKPVKIEAEQSVMFVEVKDGWAVRKKAIFHNDKAWMAQIMAAKKSAKLKDITNEG